MPQPAWVELEEFPEYVVNNIGEVRHVDRPDTIRKTSLNAQGFPVIVLFKRDSKSRYVRQINKLVLQAFGNPPDYSDQTAVWHIDGNLLNCHIDNLKWERRDRVLEWNEMHRTGTPRYRTPRVSVNRTGHIYENAYEAALAEGTLESSVVANIERYPEEYADRARYRYV